MRTQKGKIAVLAALIALTIGAGRNDAASGPTDVASKGLHLVLNVAGNRLHVYEDGVRTRSYTVSVGLPGYETPKGEYRVSEVIWNPWWHPPNSEWARGRKPESPGPDNPMGRVKLYFAPLLYIHGTPESEALGDPASRGCVRMRNSDVIELTYLVHQYATPGIDPKLLQRLEESPTMTRNIKLPTPVRFTAHYNVAAVENGFLIIYPDIYGLVKKEVRDQVELTLEEHGVDMASVNREHLERLVEKSGTRRVAISLDTLTAPVPVAAPPREPLGRRVEGR
jgi:murein L,D-transpeptidase YcbB/YkuD